MLLYCTYWRYQIRYHSNSDKNFLLGECFFFSFFPRASGDQPVITMLRDHYDLVRNWDLGAVTLYLSYNKCMTTLFKPIGFRSTQLHAENCGRFRFEDVYGTRNRPKVICLHFRKGENPGQCLLQLCRITRRNNVICLPFEIKSPRLALFIIIACCTDLNWVAHCGFTSRSYSVWDTVPLSTLDVQ